MKETILNFDNLLYTGGAISPVSQICAVTIKLPVKMVANMNVSTMEGHLLKLHNLHKYTSLPHAN